MEGAESFMVECGAESKLCVTATVFRYTISELKKSLSTKCMLHKQYLQSIFTQSILHAWLTFSAHALALERKKRELQIFAYFQSGSLVLRYNANMIIHKCILYK
jgi:hypothetical protein